MDRKLVIFLIAVGLLTLLTVALLALPGGIYEYPWLYFWLEVCSSLLAIAVVYVGLRGYAEVGSKRLLLIGLAFAAFAMLSIPRGVSAPGGYSLIFAEDGNLSLWFHNSGLLLGSALLLLSVLLPETEMASPAPVRRRYPFYWWLGALLAGLGVFILGVAGLESWLPVLWTQTGGNTLLAVVLEWMAILFQIGVVAAYLMRYLRRRQELLLLFALGIASLALGGIALSMHQHFYDLRYWLGEGLGLFAYSCFALGIWFLSRAEARPRCKPSAIRGLQ